MIHFLVAQKDNDGRRDGRRITYDKIPDNANHRTPTQTRPYRICQLHPLRSRFIDETRQAVGSIAAVKVTPDGQFQPRRSDPVILYMTYIDIKILIGRLTRPVQTIKGSADTHKVIRTG